MAIAFARARYISRAVGGSATRSAAYNAREAVTDERTGELFYFKHRDAPEHHEVLLPDGADAAFAAPAAVSDAPKEGRRLPLRPPRTAPLSAPAPLSTPSAFRPRESMRDLEAGARHKLWISMLNETDWARIRAIARQVNPAHTPAALTDLSAPLRVRACLVSHAARFPEEYVGTLRGGQVAVLMSARGDD